jgi:tetratricopeptide (TPR) repeat protein
MDTQVLDSEELLHLALHAVKQQQHSEAITLLKRALLQTPQQGRLHYLLGAEYAQIGLYERAIAAMTEAITLDSSLHLAIFQLGLLHLTQGQPELAAKVWLPLEELDAQAPLRLFSLGLQHLAKDEFIACKEKLLQGIQLNQSIPELNQDMQRILDQLPEPHTHPLSGDTGQKQSVFIQAYADLPDDSVH